MELTMNTSSRFWDKIAERYSKRPIADEAAYQRKLEISRNCFQANMDVLEFGCGTGGTAILHAPFVKHIRAIDVSPRMIQIARDKKSVVNALNVSFEVGSIESVSLPEGSFDAVLGLSILHLLNEKESVIEKIYRLLKPNSVLISSTMCLGDHSKFVKYIEPIGRTLGLMPAVKVFTSESLINALKAAGFEIEHQWQPGKGKAVLIVSRKPAGCSLAPP